MADSAGAEGWTPPPRTARVGPLDFAKNRAFPVGVLPADVQPPAPRQLLA